MQHLHYQERDNITHALQLYINFILGCFVLESKGFAVISRHFNDELNAHKKLAGFLYFFTINDAEAIKLDIMRYLPCIFSFIVKSSSQCTAVECWVQIQVSLYIKVYSINEYNVHILHRAIEKSL